MWSGKDAEIEHGRNPHSGRLRPLALEILCVPLFAQLQKILNTAIKSEIHASQTCALTARKLVRLVYALLCDNKLYVPSSF